MKYIYSLFLVFALSGCYQMVDQSDIYKATVKCGTLENVQGIRATVFGDEYTSCIKPNKE